MLQRTILRLFINRLLSELGVCREGGEANQLDTTGHSEGGVIFRCLLPSGEWSQPDFCVEKLQESKRLPKCGRLIREQVLEVVRCQALGETVFSEHVRYRLGFALLQVPYFFLDCSR